MARTTNIEQPKLKPDLLKVRFSLEFLQINHPRFPTSECTKEYYEALFQEILRYQKLTVDQFKEMQNEDHRHPITFSETSEPKGFPGIDPSDEDLWTDDAWQFALPGTKRESSWAWRVHGFISGHTFHIVWLDPCHHLAEKE